MAAKALPSAPAGANTDSTLDDPVAALTVDVPENGTAISDLIENLTHLHGTDGTKATARTTLDVYDKAAVDAGIAAVQGFNLIGSVQTLSGTSKSFAGMDNTYGVYLLRLQGVLLSGGKIELRTRKDGSGSYQSGASDYDTWKEGNSAAGSSSVIDASSSDSLSNVVAAQAEFWIENARINTVNCFIHGWVMRKKQSGNFGITHISAEFAGGLDAIQGIQVRANGASFTGGKAALYGVRGMVGG